MKFPYQACRLLAGALPILLQGACAQIRPFITVVGLDRNQTFVARVNEPLHVTARVEQTGGGVVAGAYTQWTMAGDGCLHAPNFRNLPLSALNLSMATSQGSPNGGIEITGTPSRVGRFCIFLTAINPSLPDEPLNEGFTLEIRPKITQLLPSSVPAQNGPFQLRVIGAEFFPVDQGGTEVLWNGSSRSTQFVSSTEVLADITGADAAAAATAQIAIRNGDPNIGGGTSNTLPFTITAAAGSPPLVITTTPLPNGTVGQSYSATLQASGATGPLTWSLASTSPVLPAGLALSAAGVISGAPTNAGTTNHVFQVQDAGRVATQALSITISPAPAPPLQITTNTLPLGVVGQPYTVTLAATGGTGAYAWSLSGTSPALPAGLTLSSLGVLSGTPTAAVSRSLIVEVRDTAGSVATATLAITINAPPTPLQITRLTMPNASEHGNYSETITVAGGSPPYSFSISAGALPGNVVLDSNLGILNGINPAGGSHTFSVRVQDSSSPQQTATQQYSILIIQVPPAALPDAVVGQPYAHMLGVIGHLPPVTWTLSPTSPVPIDFTLDALGNFTGTPTLAGVLMFCPRATDSDTPPRFDQECFTLTINNPVPAITTLAPATAVEGSAAFTLTVNGSGFVSTSAVRWNGLARATTFVSSTQLTASITAGDIASAGNASVTVFNPAPGGGTSNSLPFTVTATPPPPGGSAGVTDLVSQSTANIPANQSSAVTGMVGRLISISADGNRVAFASEATNLDGLHRGVFVRDIALGATRKVSVTLLDATPDSVVGESLAISKDGNWIAFESRANNHVSGDSGSDGDVFVVNACLPHVAAVCPAPDWISVMPDGSEPPTGASGSPSLSADGRIVAFHSNSPLTVGAGGLTQIFVRDRQTNVTTLVSLDDQGNPGFGGDSFHPSVSANGRFVAFVSSAALIATDMNGRPDVYVYDTCFSSPGPCTPGISRVSEATGRIEATGGSMFDFFPPSISDDGRFVVFASSATNLVPNDTNGLIDVFIHDRLDSPIPTTVRASFDTSGNPILGLNPTISGDGRFVSFESGQAYVRDTCFGAAGCTPRSVIVGRVPNGPLANSFVDQPVISGNGLFVAFRSAATNLVAGITSGISHIYRAVTD